MAGSCRLAPEFREPRLVDTAGTKSGHYPNLAVLPNGNAAVVWVESHPRDPNAPGDEVWLNQYKPATGWGTPERVESNLIEPYYPRISLEASGNITVLWASQERGLFFNWVKRYEPGSGWGATTRPLSSRTLGSPLAATLALAPDGSTYALWAQQITDGAGMLFYTRHTSASGWTPAAQVNLPGASEVLYGYDVKFDAGANAVFVWSERNGPRSKLWSRRFSPSNGLEATPALLEDHDELSVGSSAIAFDSRGNAVLAWTAHVPGSVAQTRDSSSVWGRVYSPFCGWSSRIQLDAGTTALYPQVVMTGIGRATVVWTSSQVVSAVSGIGLDLWAAEFDSSNGWSPPQRMSSNPAPYFSSPHFAADGDGNGLLVWSQPSLAAQAASIWARRFDRAIGWGQPRALSVLEDYESAMSPLVAFAANGTAIVSWYTQRYPMKPQTVWVRHYE
jgi:hypothetical protein